jgi:septal ring factor EnvC (AmiA/AmiB activator)
MDAATLDDEFPVMRSEHRFWHAENDRWKQDIVRWQSEINAAWQQLRGFEEAVQDFSRGLAEHAAAIEENERALKKHEDSMMTYERGDDDVAVQETFREQHLQQAALHVSQRNRHEDVSRNLHRFLARVDALTAGVHE